MDKSTSIGHGDCNGSLQNYKLGRKLGSGTYAKVKLAVHTPTGIEVAIKIIGLQDLDQKLDQRAIRREIQIQRLLRHPNIVKLYEVIETPQIIYLVMEHVDFKDLFYFLMAKGRLQEDHARLLFQQIISGVEYCHRNMVVHRDLKAENILLNKDGQLKIADFGLSNTFQNGQLLKTHCGSPNYAAPEVISKADYYGPPVDVWSSGIILYAILCGQLPFDDGNIPHMFKIIKSGIFTIPSHLSIQAKDLICRMLTVDPTKRIRIPEIRHHPWFQQNLSFNIVLPQPDPSEAIDKEVLGEVVKMGYDGNLLVESLRHRTQNEATVAYFLLLDKRKQ